MKIMNFFKTKDQRLNDLEKENQKLKEHIIKLAEVQRTEFQALTELTSTTKEIGVQMQEITKIMENEFGIIKDKNTKERATYIG